MDHDALDVIAESYRLTAQTQLLLARLQVFALTLLGLSLLGTGVLVWQACATRQEHAAQTQALRAATQTLTAQTQALLEVLRQRQSP
jgi:hypothetical protein